MNIKSKWYVITGGPSSGKKTVLGLLKAKGYRVIPEVARGVIDRANRQGISTKALRKDEAKFQESLLPIKLRLEQNLPRDQVIFWNRAMPDSIAYLQNCGGDPKEAVALCERGLYKRVFLLEQLPEFARDYARTEDKSTAEKISQLLREAYEQLGYEVIFVPVMSAEERVKFIQGQMPDFRIGVATSAWDKVAWDLVKEVAQNFQVAFVFVTREEGETRYGDLMIHNVRVAGVPLITFSSLRFKPELRKADKETWRLEYDREVMKLLPPTELIVLLGYMWWFGKEMCQKKTAINLHPALPDGPKGTYREVIWHLIKDRVKETGVMIHLVIPELDRGPAIAFCRFSISGEDFNHFWQEMEKRLEKESLEEIADKEGENNFLFKLIRQRGVIREFPMVIWTTKILAERRIKIENDRVVDSEGRVLEGGYDMTKEIDTAIKEKI